MRRSWAWAIFLWWRLCCLGTGAKYSAPVQGHYLLQQAVKGILVAYQSYLLRSLSESHRSSPQQLDELHLVNKNLLHVPKLNGQAVGRNLAALVAARRQLWLSQAQITTDGHPDQSRVFV